MRSHNIKQRSLLTVLSLHYNYAVKDEFDDKNIPRTLSIPVYIRDMILLRTFYTGCNRRNGPDFGRVFLRSNYTDITQNTYIQS